MSSRRPISTGVRRIVQSSVLLLGLVVALFAVNRVNPSPWLTGPDYATTAAWLTHPWLLTAHARTSGAGFLRVPVLLPDRLRGSEGPLQGCSPVEQTHVEPRERAAIVLLLREADLDELLPTLDNFEQRFNGGFRYPYVFFSSPDQPPLSQHFRDRIAAVLPVGALVEFALVPLEHWSLPDNLDAEGVRVGLAEMERAGVQYGGREGYHHMCRFYSGFFARQQVLQKYDWYWRLEPGGTSWRMPQSGPAPH